jgi:hypothetical protein
MPDAEKFAVFARPGLYDKAIIRWSLKEERIF